MAEETTRLRPLLPLPLADDGPQSSSTSASVSRSQSEPRAPNGPVTAPDGNSLTPRRRAVPVACEPCRRRKARCDGERPSCAGCRRKNVECSYRWEQTQLERGENRLSSLVKRVAELEAETLQLNEILQLLSKLPRPASHGILDRIRSARDDPRSVLRLVKEASLLIPGPNMDGHIPTAYDPRLRALDEKALAESLLKVPARPWTTVADDGIVSELVTSFFVWDDAFIFPFLDRDAFIQDMRQCKPDTAKYCSPFLVNAICAYKYCTSPTARHYNRTGGMDLENQFLEEAKALHNDEAGRASMPTVQALSLLFATYANKGSDKPAMIYRYAASAMFRQLGLEKSFNMILGDRMKTMQAKTLSKFAWGFYCWDSISSYLYLQRTSVRPPRIPRCPDSRLNSATENVDFFGRLYTAENRSPPFIQGSLDAQCDLCVLLYEAMTTNRHSDENNETGSSGDISARVTIYRKLQEWRNRLPRRLRREINHTPQSCFLGVLYSEVMIAILRPLHSSTPIECDLEVRNICTQLATADIIGLEQYVEIYSLNSYSPFICLGSYNALITLAPYLYDPDTHDIFSRAACLMRAFARDIPAGRLVLLAVKALVWALKASIPAMAEPHFADLDGGEQDLTNVPLAFALPDLDALKMLQDGGLYCAVDIGMLLSRWWCALSNHDQD